MVAVDRDFISSNSDLLSRLAKGYMELRQAKEPEMTLDSARSYLIDNPAAYAAMLVKKGMLHGVIGGKYSNSGHFLGPVLRIMGNGKTVSAVGIVDYPESYGYDLLGVGDVALNVNVGTGDRLEDVIVNSQEIFMRLLGVVNPRVALISSSTGSYNPKSEADKLIREWNEKYGNNHGEDVFGPCQADAALVPRVAMNKEGCPFTNRPADIHVYTELAGANSAYKYIEFLARAAEGIPNQMMDYVFGVLTRQEVQLTDECRSELEGLRHMLDDGVKTIFLLPVWIQADDLSRGSDVYSTKATIAAQVVKSSLVPPNKFDYEFVRKLIT